MIALVEAETYVWDSRVILNSFFSNIFFLLFHCFMFFPSDSVTIMDAFLSATVYPLYFAFYLFT